MDYVEFVVIEFVSRECVCVIWSRKHCKFLRRQSFRKMMKDRVGEHMLNEGIVSIMWFILVIRLAYATLISYKCKLCGSI